MKQKCYMIYFKNIQLKHIIDKNMNYKVNSNISFDFFLNFFNLYIKHFLR